MTASAVWVNEFTAMLLPHDLCRTAALSYCNIRVHSLPNFFFSFSWYIFSQTPFCKLYALALEQVEVRGMMGNFRCLYQGHTPISHQSILLTFFPFVLLSLFVMYSMKIIYRYTLFFCASKILCFHKLKVCDNPASSKSVGTILPVAFPHFASPCHILVILQYFKLSLHYCIWYGDLWSVIFGITREKPTTSKRLWLAKGSQFLAIKYF